MHRNFIRRHGTAVWLDISVDEAWSRCATAGGRPLFTTPDELTALLEARRSRYELAEHRIDVNQRSISEIAHEIAERLAGGETPESSDDEAQA
jgi:shikimate kinase